MNYWYIYNILYIKHIGWEKLQMKYFDKNCQIFCFSKMLLFTSTLAFTIPPLPSSSARINARKGRSSRTRRPGCFMVSVKLKPPHWYSKAYQSPSLMCTMLIGVKRFTAHNCLYAFWQKVSCVTYYSDEMSLGFIINYWSTTTTSTQFFIPI